MRKHLLLAILISLLNPLFVAASLQSGAGNVSGAQSSSAPVKIQPAEAQADFDLMRKALEEAHTGLYRFSTKAEMDKVFDTQRAKLSRPMTKTEFLARVLADEIEVGSFHCHVRFFLAEDLDASDGAGLGFMDENAAISNP